MAAGRFAAVAALAFAITVASCLWDPDPQYRPLRFGLLIIPSHVAAGDSAVIDVAFIVGPQTCWRLHSLGVVIAADTVAVEGTAVLPHPDSFCGDELVTDRRSIKVPPLQAGTYVVRAGALVDTMVVGDDGTTSPDRIVLSGTVNVTTPGCGYTYVEGGIEIALSGLPPDLVDGHYLLRGALRDDDPCETPQPWHDWMDYFVAVRDLTPQ